MLLLPGGSASVGRLINTVVKGGRKTETSKDGRIKPGRMSEKRNREEDKEEDH